MKEKLYIMKITNTESGEAEYIATTDFYSQTCSSLFDSQSAEFKDMWEFDKDSGSEYSKENIKIEEKEIDLDLVKLFNKK